MENANLSTVYEADTTAEAYMIAGLLQQLEMQSVVSGSRLTGAIGELPVTGLIKVQVPTAMREEAIKVIEQWDKSNPAEDTVPAANQTSTFFGKTVIFLFGLALGATALFIYDYSPSKTVVSEDGIDYNGDGELDEKWIFNGSFIKEQRFDRNRDGTWDDAALYNDKGLIQTVISDNNFDGHFENSSEYQNGLLIFTKTDENKDNRPELISKFRHGVLYKTWYYDLVTGKLVHEQTFKDGALVSARLDSNSDGTLDTDINYDAYERPIKNP